MVASPNRKCLFFFVNWDGAQDLKLGDLQYYVLVTAFRISPGSSGDAGKLTFFPSDQWRPALFSNMPLASGRVHVRHPLRARACVFVRGVGGGRESRGSRGGLECSTKCILS